MFFVAVLAGFVATTQGFGVQKKSKKLRQTEYPYAYALGSKVGKATNENSEHAFSVISCARGKIVKQVKHSQNAFGQRIYKSYS